MDVDNTELTSTMGNSVPHRAAEDKNESSDSTPTSSTDAFNSTSTQPAVADDPISSTSSDVEPIRQPIITDSDSLDMNTTTSSNEKISENVEDIAQDLENLLGEPSNSYFNSNKSRKTDKKGDALLDKMISLDEDEFNNEFNLSEGRFKIEEPLEEKMKDSAEEATSIPVETSEENPSQNEAMQISEMVEEERDIHVEKIEPVEEVKKDDSLSMKKGDKQVEIAMIDSQEPSSIVVDMVEEDSPEENKKKSLDLVEEKEEEPPPPDIPSRVSENPKEQQLQEQPPEGNQQDQKHCLLEEQQTLAKSTEQEKLEKPQQIEDEPPKEKHVQEDKHHAEKHSEEEIPKEVGLGVVSVIMPSEEASSGTGPVTMPSGQAAISVVSVPMLSEGVSPSATPVIMPPEEAAFSVVPVHISSEEFSPSEGSVIIPSEEAATSVVPVPMSSEELSPSEGSVILPSEEAASSVVPVPMSSEELSPSEGSVILPSEEAASSVVPVPMSSEELSPSEGSVILPSEEAASSVVPVPMSSEEVSPSEGSVIMPPEEAAFSVVPVPMLSEEGSPIEGPVIMPSEEAGPCASSDVMPFGETNLSACPVIKPSEEIDLSAGPVIMPSEEDSVNVDALIIPTEEVGLSAGPVIMPSEEDSVNVDALIMPSEDVGLSADPVIMPSEEAAVSVVPVSTPSEEANFSVIPVSMAPGEAGVSAVPVLPFCENKESDKIDQDEKLESAVLDNEPVEIQCQTKPVEYFSDVSDVNMTAEEEKVDFPNVPTTIEETDGNAAVPEIQEEPVETNTEIANDIMAIKEVQEEQQEITEAVEDLVKTAPEVPEEYPPTQPVEDDNLETLLAVASLVPVQEFKGHSESIPEDIPDIPQCEDPETNKAVEALQSLDGFESVQSVADDNMEIQSAVDSLNLMESVQSEVERAVESLYPTEYIEDVQPGLVENLEINSEVENAVQMLQSLEPDQQIETIEKNEPIQALEQIEPIGLIKRNEPVQLFEQIEPTFPIERNEPIEPIQQSEPVQIFAPLKPFQQIVEHVAPVGHTQEQAEVVQPVDLTGKIEPVAPILPTTIEPVQPVTPIEPVKKTEPTSNEQQQNVVSIEKIRDNRFETTSQSLSTTVKSFDSPEVKPVETKVVKGFLSSALQDQQIRSAVESITIHDLLAGSKIPNKEDTNLKQPLVISVDDIIERDKPYSPKIKIKPIKEPDEEKAPLKMTITKQSASMHSSILKIYNPDMDATMEQRLDEEPIPKLKIKNIPSPEQHSPKSSRKVFSPSTSNQTRSSSPRITIKPLVKPNEPERAVSPLKITIRKEEKHSPKLTIKPIVKPPEEEKVHSPRVTIKPIPRPVEKNKDIVDLTNIQDKPSPKITIKPVFRPDDVEDNKEEEERERIVLKINKGTIPTTPRKREYEDEREKLGKIKLKFSKEGGHAQIVQHEPEDMSVKRIKLDQENSKLKEMLSCTSEPQSDSMSLVEDLMSKNSPIVISEESNQSSCILIEDKDSATDPVFEAVSAKVVEPPPPPVSVAIPEVQPVVPAPPRKRGRPRKVPLVVREEFKDPKEEEKPPVEYSTRPKRSCRGPSVRTTLGIKPRKTRGPGRGRGGKRNMGDREPGPSAKQVKEPRSKRLRESNLIQKEYEENLLKTPQISETPTSTPSAPTPSDIVMFEEETRMSAETSASTSRAQTPAKQIPTPITAEVEESQSSVQSTATTESVKEKRKSRMEIQEPEGAVISADQLAEYYWSGGGPFMLQEQVAQFLGIKSFKRKYPNIPRRTVDMQERDFIRESGLAGEAMCDLGLTAVNSADILDIMYSDFQDKYEEYCKHQRDRQAKDLINKQKALSLAASQEKTKYDITQQAVQSAAAWNATFNRARRDQRKACMDLQTLTIHYPKGKIKQINKPKLGHYPVALVPGQFTDFYADFTPNDISGLPINTIVYGNINARLHEDMEVDSQTDGSGSESESSTSDSDSSFSGSSDGEDCNLCKTTTKKIAT